MGTRGSVAWRDGDNVVGVYNHWDSYPTVLGKSVWDAVQKDGIAKVLDGLKSVGDWREFESGGICAYCGKKEGQPHSISGLICGFDLPDTNKPAAKTAEEKEVEENIKKTGHPDPEAKWHQHGDSAADHFDPFTDPLFMEWIYILDPEKNVIEIWAHCTASEEARVILKRENKKVSNPVSSERQENPWTYAHYLVDEIAVDGEEPGWDYLQERDSDFCERLYASEGAA